MLPAQTFKAVEGRAGAEEQDSAAIPYSVCEGYWQGDPQTNETGRLQAENNFGVGHLLLRDVRRSPIPPHAP